MNVAGKSVVITGASSGIGRATAMAFARAGAHVVVGARREQVLSEVVRECEEVGASALAVATDVTVPHEVERLAHAARERFGGIHVWISNAGVGVFGAFPEGGVAAHARVVETNLLGTIYGTAAALPVMRSQGEGVVIVVSSIGGLVPVPYAATYAASKAGIRAFASSLREELREAPGLHVCTVLPSFVDTPAIEHHGANVSGRELAPSGQILAPEDVADKILALAKAPRAEVDIGWATTGARIGGSVSQTLTSWIGGMAVRRYLSRARPAEQTLGSLFDSKPEGTSISGTLRDKSQKQP